MKYMCFAVIAAMFLIGCVHTQSIKTEEEVIWETSSSEYLGPDGVTVHTVSLYTFASLEPKCLCGVNIDEGTGVLYIHAAQEVSPGIFVLQHVKIWTDMAGRPVKAEKYSVRGHEKAFLQLDGAPVSADIFRSSCLNAAKRLPPETQKMFRGYGGIGLPG